MTQTTTTRHISRNNINETGLTKGTMTNTNIGDIVITRSRGCYRTGTVTGIGRTNITVSYITEAGLKEAAKRISDARTTVNAGISAMLAQTEQRDFDSFAYYKEIAAAGEQRGNYYYLGNQAVSADMIHGGWDAYRSGIVASEKERFAGLERIAEMAPVDLATVTNKRTKQWFLA